MIVSNESWPKAPLTTASGGVWFCELMLSAKSCYFWCSEAVINLSSPAECCSSSGDENWHPALTLLKRVQNPPEHTSTIFWCDVVFARKSGESTRMANICGIGDDDVTRVKRER